jgi:serine protease Do
LDNLFNNLFPQSQSGGSSQQVVAGGSGFFVSPDGLIVTNKHVVDDKTAQYTVLTNDGREYPAKVVALDPVLDIGFVRVQGKNFPYLQFDDSDKLSVGQTAIAIGNALGEFKNTVSVGVVSGLSRSIVAGDVQGNTETLDQVIQTDAAINPGNSGGPLIDLSGRVVGINVAVAESGENIAFALPANVVRTAVDSVRRTGIVVRPFLGVHYVQVTPDVKNQEKLSVDYGALVIKGSNGEAAVMPSSPAADAGIMEGDIILEADGTKITPEHSLGSIVRVKGVGDSVTLLILHKGVQKTAKIQLKAYPQ